MTYDVICRWIRHILERFEQRYPHLKDIVAKTKMLLPSMHIHAHQELCQLVYALRYAEGCALMHGEGVETPWAELNAAGYSTREMTAGARHDSLQALFNFWNWVKLEKLGACDAISIRTTADFWCRNHTPQGSRARVRRPIEQHALLCVPVWESWRKDNGILVQGGFRRQCTHPVDVRCQREGVRKQRAAGDSR